MKSFSNDRSQVGFTLLEVLVSLAIISIALLAALRASGQATNNVNELRTRLLASWVAENRLAKHRLHGDWLPLGIERGKENEGNIEFSWREEVVATPNHAFRRLDIFIYIAPEETHVLSHFTSFIVNPPGKK